MNRKCIECDKPTTALVCAECERKLMTSAEERGIPVIGKSSAPRPIGFSPRSTR